MLPDNHDVRLVSVPMISHEDCIVTSNTITKKTGTYQIYSRNCSLDLIEISNPNYYKCGIASKIFEIVLQICKEMDIDKVVGNFKPYDNQHIQAFEFYKRNGFKFEKCGSDTLVIKYLSKENTSIK